MACEVPLAAAGLPFVAGDIPKNLRESVRVFFVEFYGHFGADLRVHYTKSDGEITTTKKGVFIPIERLADVIAALEAVQTEALLVGVMPPVGGE